MGDYITPAGLCKADRFRPGNIYPLVLRPHGSNFADVVKALGRLGMLDKAITSNIKGKCTTVCAFALCYTGDMPQQAENSGLKGPRGIKFCRCCFIASTRNSQQPSTTLDFDVVTHGRYHHQLKRMQKTMADIHEDKATKAAYGSQWGIANPAPPLETISPALDLILSRPFDTAHSEYAGLTNLMHSLIRDGVLTPSAVDEYTLELRAWPFPPGGRRLQSPKHHLASYNMSSHAIWSIIIPPFLRSWLRPHHIKANFYREASQDHEPIDIVIQACTAIAKSNSLLMGSKSLNTSRIDTLRSIRKARELFNQLCVYASRSLNSRAGSVMSVQGQDNQGTVGDDIAASGRSLQYLNDTLRPNIHIASHFMDFIEEYGLITNCNTLTGEDLHRQVYFISFFLA